MGAIVAKASGHTEGTRRDREVTLPLLGAARSHTAVTSSDASVSGDWILPLIQRAQERVMAQKEAVLTMGIDRAQYIRNLQGDGHLSVRRLGLLGEDFWRALVDELNAYFKLDDDTRQLERALEGLSASVQVIATIARKHLK